LSARLTVVANIEFIVAASLRGNGASHLAFLDLHGNFVLQELLILLEHLETKGVKLNSLAQRFLHLNSVALDRAIRTLDVRLNLKHLLFVELNGVKFLIWSSRCNLFENLQDPLVFVLKRENLHRHLAVVLSKFHHFLA